MRMRVHAAVYLIVIVSLYRNYNLYVWIQMDTVLIISASKVGEGI